MAEKATRKRKRRSAEEIIADLEAEIRRVKQRAAAREAKSVPEGKAFLAAIKAIDKASEAAKSAKNQEMLHALETARATLGEHALGMGLRVPTSTGRGGRRRKREAAA